MRPFILTLLAATLSGCHVVSTAGAYRWTVKAPAKVDDAPHSKLRFVVETIAPDGTPVEGIAYVWVVDWVGLHGVEHQGYSYREEAIRVKGGPGVASLKILALDRYDRLVVVATTTFEVNPVQALSP